MSENLVYGEALPVGQEFWVERNIELFSGDTPHRFRCVSLAVITLALLPMVQLYFWTTYFKVTLKRDRWVISAILVLLLFMNFMLLRKILSILDNHILTPVDEEDDVDVNLQPDPLPMIDLTLDDD